MVIKALESITQIADLIEKEWDKQIEELVKKAYPIKLSIHEDHFNNGVFEELKVRYNRVGWSLYHDNECSVQFSYRKEQ